MNAMHDQNSIDWREKYSPETFQMCQIYDTDVEHRQVRRNDEETDSRWVFFSVTNANTAEASKKMRISL